MEGSYWHSLIDNHVPHWHSWQNVTHWHSLYHSKHVGAHHWHSPMTIDHWHSFDWKKRTTPLSCCISKSKCSQIWQHCIEVNEFFYSRRILIPEFSRLPQSLMIYSRMKRKSMRKLKNKDEERDQYQIQVVAILIANISLTIPKSQGFLWSIACCMLLGAKVRWGLHT